MFRHTFTKITCKNGFEIGIVKFLLTLLKSRFVPFTQTS